ncbi:homocysteine S-methyltransferase family protein [Rhodobacter sp. SY28-1]|uniref:homocysteine S-methyltransferase family protein n=1 Tax=Rhodobacter sp. SY28-1 TaxID=2562317 RepID=UPI0010C10455|nr:homocysteine S-methyltransferase family protein [Rhodobacter sp. SY28-1]
MTRIDRLMAATKPWPADAGLETAMIFHEGFDLPQFASFVLLDDPKGRAALGRWFDGFVDLARRGGTGFVLDTATWRANMGWAGALGLDEAAIRRVNADAVAFAKNWRDRHETETLPILVNGVVGPSGDGYVVTAARTAEAAEQLHWPQVQALAAAGADLVTAVTMNYTAEAIGVARAAQRAGMPHVLSLTVETDGNLPSGQDLQEALAEIEAATDGSALFYMVNCAHPSHFSHRLDGPMRNRIGGIRANASRLSHAELDAATELDDGNPQEFGTDYAAFRQLLPGLRIIGGCCGSDHRHVASACAHLHAHAA